MKRSPLKRSNSLSNRGTGLKRTGKLKVKKKDQETVDQEVADRAKMYSVFVQVWDSRSHNSEVSGIALGHELKSTYVHHILSKSKYKQAMYDEDNLVLLTWEEHAQVEQDMYCYEEVNKRREQLKQKYDL